MIKYRVFILTSAVLCQVGAFDYEEIESDAVLNEFAQEEAKSIGAFADASSGICGRSNSQCMPRLECTKRGGQVLDRCYVFSVCCETKPLCGGIVSSKTAYFSSPNNLTQNECSLQIRPANNNICQLRLDFEEFLLAPPRSSSPMTAPTCVDDLFTITTETSNSLKMPPLCGQNSGQHLYIPVKAATISNTMATLGLQLSSNSTLSRTPKWKIKITQLQCANSVGRYDAAISSITQMTNFIPRSMKSYPTGKSSDVKAPDGCLQYFTNREGSFESFNNNNGNGEYIGGLTYAICFQRSPDTCGLRLTAANFQMSYNVNSTFATDRDCDTAGGEPASTTLISDYLLVPNGRTDNGTLADKFCNNAIADNPITALTPGPLYALFSAGSAATNVTEENKVRKGFKINYRILNTGC